MDIIRFATPLLLMVVGGIQAISHGWVFLGAVLLLLSIVFVTAILTVVYLTYLLTNLLMHVSGRQWKPFFRRI